MKQIPAGRYMMGFELSGEVTSKMFLVPVGARNIPNWSKAFTIDEADFNGFMQARALRRYELQQRAEEAKASRSGQK